jgi:hypothetical protein
LSPKATTSQTRSGAIVLTRHGEPALSRKVRLNAREYREFWARYEVLGLLPGQSPPGLLLELAERCGVLVSSTRLRSVESATALARGRDFVQHAILVEAPLPPPSWPDWLKLPPNVWGFLARFWWWFFNHHQGGETRRQAEARAAGAATVLETLAARGRS